MITARERFLGALSRRSDDYTPFHIRFTEPVRRLLQAKTGAVDPEEYFELDVRTLELQFTRPANGEKQAAYQRYYTGIPPGSIMNPWGVLYVPEVTGQYHHRIPPLARAASVREIECFPGPDFSDDCLYEPIRVGVQRAHERGLAVMGLFGTSTFDNAWQIRGYEQLLMDMCSDPDMANAVLDHVAERLIMAARKLTETGVDMVGWGEDVGMQTAMILSPDLWREYIRPRFARMIHTARRCNPEILIFYHSDGCIEPIIPDLIEIGVDILNPVQPECMSPDALKQAYGDSLSFWGGLGTQTTMPFGSPNEVRGVVRHLIDTVGKGGGFVIAPSHKIEPDVPWENVEAFVDAAREYGHLHMTE
jgi:uroporphyrinogen decarboxylase